ncbi:MAG: GNAT family N-acetyltransferase [Acidobacteriota bacterium]|nr:GNAT family N-acetyltransferase [Acidobacteriota bacterium]
MNWEIIHEYPNAETAAKWFAFLPDSTFPCQYTSPGFFEEPFFEDKNPFAVLVTDGEKIVGALTGIFADKKIVCGLEVRPQISIASDGDQKSIAQAFVEALLTLAKNGAELIQINCSDAIAGFVEAGFTYKKAVGTSEVIMLDLRAGKDAVFKKFSQTRRADLRKAMRENQVQISELENADELAELYEIHVAWSSGKGNQPNSWETMKRLWAMKNYRRIFIAKHDGKVIAGSYFRFLDKMFIEYAANNSLPEFQRLRPNDLLVWHSIEWACDREIPLYSMGGSHLFLRRFGGYAVSGSRYQLDRTLLKKHSKKEAIAEFALKTYQGLPTETREKIKKIFGKD